MVAKVNSSPGQSVLPLVNIYHKSDTLRGRVLLENPHPCRQCGRVFWAGNPKEPIASLVAPPSVVYGSSVALAARTAHTNQRNRSQARLSTQLSPSATRFWSFIALC